MNQSLVKFLYHRIITSTTLYIEENMNPQDKVRFCLLARPTSLSEVDASGKSFWDERSSEACGSLIIVREAKTPSSF